jgi:WD40 repeat protein
VFNNNGSTVYLINSFKAHNDSIIRIKPSPFNDTFVATCSLDFTVKIWDVSNSSHWTMIQTYTNHTNQVFGLEFINEGSMASGSNDNTIRIWSICTGLTNRTFHTGHTIRSLQLLSNGYHLASGLSNGRINIYNINTGSLIVILAGHTSHINDLVLIGDDLLASSSDDCKIGIWNLTSNNSSFFLTGHNQTIYGLRRVSSSILASGSGDETIKLWNVTNGALIRTLSGHTSGIYRSVDVINYDKRLLISGSTDSSIKVWDVNTGNCLFTFSTMLQIKSLAVLNLPLTSTSNLLFF